MLAAPCRRRLLPPLLCPLLLFPTLACPPTGSSRDTLARDLGPTPCQLAATPSVVTVAQLTQGRRTPALGVLPGGELLLAGGLDLAGAPLASAERIQLSSPAAVLATGSLAVARGGAGFATTPSGVLLVGGAGAGGAGLRSLELYQPGLGTFRALGAELAVGRDAPSLTPLSDGRLLIVGGQPASGLVLGTLELLSPASEMLLTLPLSLAEPRARHATLRLPGESCVADGGLRDAGLRDARTRDAGSRDWARDRGATSSKDRAAAADRSLCQPEAVLFAGGESASGALQSLELLRLAGPSLRSLTAKLPRPAADLAAAALPDGRVLLAGGWNPVDGALTTSQVYDPRSELLLASGSLASARSGFALTPLADGRLLASGGLGASGPLRSLELYDPALGLWQLLPVQLARARHGHVALLLPDCRVLVAGGAAGSGPGSQPEPPRELELVTIPAPRSGLDL